MKAHVLMLGGAHQYPGDTRTRQESQTLVADGYEVTIAASRRLGQRVFEKIGGVNVIRVPRAPALAASNGKDMRSPLARRLVRFLSHALEHAWVTLSSFLVTLAMVAARGVDVVHVHNPPDTFWLWGWAFKALGVKFVFDHHDLAPELYLSRYGASRAGSLFHRLLLLSERLSCRSADVIIATNESYKELAVCRGGARPEDVFVVRNGPDLRRVRLKEKDPRLVGLNRKLLGYIGVMNPQDGLDYLLRALWHLAYEFGRRDFFCMLIGPGDCLDDLAALARELKLEGHVHFTGFIPDEQVFRYLSAVDVCVDPDPSSPLNDRSTWIKIMEFMALGKPIVCFDLKETRVTAEKAAIYVQPNDVREFAKAIIKLLDNPELGKRMGEYGRQRVERELQWNHVRHNLLRAYEHLNTKRQRVAQRPDGRDKPKELSDLRPSGERPA
jgi:glycosyltransferase involved in cell wall biosynthesis